MNTQTAQFSRADYMNNTCSHYEYYSQFVTQGMKDVILRKYSKEELQKAYGKDEHLNNIPLRWWDSYEEFFKQSIAGTNQKLNGARTWSSSQHTCSMKAAARQIIES